MGERERDARRAVWLARLPRPVGATIASLPQRRAPPGEHAANLRAVVGLEPELFARVVAEGGAAPERLTLVRKALGLESHKGGAPFALGTSGDVCLRSWLATKTDEAACATGAQVERP